MKYDTAELHRVARLRARGERLTEGDLWVNEIMEDTWVKWADQADLDAAERMQGEHF